MRSHRGSWLGPCLLAAVIVAMPAACTVVRAQPGFGADPFWPYNQQYTPYTAPIGPADPAAGGRAAYLPRDGIRGANQFQQYLEGLQGGNPGRNVSDRAGVGMPYYRSSVDPQYDLKGTRQYTPNQRSTESFQRAQQRVADRYFAYYSTRDPARRAELLKEYRAARREAQRITTGRGSSPSRGPATSSRLEPALRERDDAGRAAAREGVRERAAPRSDRFGSAPEVPGIGSARTSGSRARPSTPADVLNRSRAMDRNAGIRSGLGPSAVGPRIRRPSGDADPPTRRGSTYSSRSNRTRRTRPIDTDMPRAVDDKP